MNYTLGSLSYFLELLNNSVTFLGLRVVRDDKEGKEAVRSKLILATSVIRRYKRVISKDYIESFHSRLRYDLLDTKLFGSLHETKVIVKQWKMEYNHKRAYSS